MEVESIDPGLSLFGFDRRQCIIEAKVRQKRKKQCQVGVYIRVLGSTLGRVEVYGYFSCPPLSNLLIWRKLNCLSFCFFLPEKVCIELYTSEALQLL